MEDTLAVVVFVVGLTLISAKAPRDGTLNFVIMGDWGGQDTPPYYTTAEEEVHVRGLPQYIYTQVFRARRTALTI